MTAFKNYLGYRLKSSFVSTLSFALIALLITITTASEGVSSFEYDQPVRTGIESLATIMGIIASIIPMLETDIFKNRRNLDTLYFLPLSRFKMALAHYISGLIQMFAIYTVAFLGHFLVLCKYAKYFKLQYMPLYYILLLLLGVAIYSIFIFLYGEANSTADGVICSVMWIFALYLFALVVIIPIREYAFNFVYKPNGVDVSPEYFDFTRDINSFALWLLPYTSINNLTVIFQDVMEGTRSWVGVGDCYDIAWVYEYPTLGEAIAERYSGNWYMIFFPIIAGAASVFGYFRTFAGKGAEKAGEVSSSWFCYKTLIPAYGFMGLVFTGFSGIMFFLIVAAMYLAYAIYRKSFKIRKADIFSMAGAAAAAFAFLLANSIIFSDLLGDLIIFS